MDGDAPEPIEVELVAHDPRPDRGGRRRREPDPPEAVESETHGDHSVARARSERSRLVSVAAVAAVLALALGWMIGRATSGESDAVADDATGTARASTTVAAPFATLPIDGEEIDGADFEEPAEEEPAVTAPTLGPTTTEVTGTTVEPIAVDPHLAGAPIRLVGIEFGGALAEADLAAGTLARYHAPGRVTSDGSPLVLGPDWVVSSWNGLSRVTAADGTTTEIDLGDSWQILHVPGTELFWRPPRTQTAGGGPVYSLVDLAGDPVGPELELPLNSWPVLVDPATGGLVVGAGSRNYAVHPDGVDYLGLGAVIGVSSEMLVTYDCDAELVCSLYRIDRASGAATVVPPDPALTAPYQWMSMAGWGGGSTDPMSPDGRWVALIGSTWDSSVAGIVELETGRFVELAEVSSPPFVVWSPDSRFAFALDQQTPMAYDVTTGERFPVFTDAVQWSQLGARPFAIESPAAAGSDAGTLLRVVPGTTRNGTSSSGAAEEAVEG